MAPFADNSVIVVGAGVSGLTTAICLAESGLNVRVVARDRPSQTTSAVAGASWGPYLVSDPRVLPWSEVTRRELESIAGDRLQPTGVRLVDGTEVSDEEIEAPAWAQAVAGFRPCEPHELPAGYVSGWHYTIPLVDMPAYLAYLEGRLAAAGVSVESGTVRRLDDLAGQASLVVNCTGLGARDLVPDPDVSPVRGQLVVVRNPGVHRFFQDEAEGEDMTYFLPHGDHVVLGGSAIPGSQAAEPDPEIARRIIERCARIEPRFADAEVLDNRVGFRPARSTVRLEREGAVVHNYGHGANGLTLSWGCARDVLAEIVGLGSAAPTR